MKKFLVIGGMPVAVKIYIANGDMLEVQRFLDDLMLSIQADFAKYKSEFRLQEPVKYLML